MCAIRAVVVDLPLVPVTAMNGASGALLARSRAEQFDVADDLHAGGAGFLHRPVRLGVCERHAGRQHQRRELAPVCGRKIFDR